MNDVRNTKGWAIVACALCCVAFMASLLGFAPHAQAALTKVDIPYTQVFTTDDPSADATFTYTLVAKDYTVDTPMPLGSTGDTFSFDVTGNASGSVTFDTAGAPNGTYEYTIQDATDHKPNYTYEQRTYTVKAYVDGTYTVVTIERNSDGKKVGLVELDPSYTAPIPSTGQITVEKSVESAQVQPNGTIVYGLTVTNVSSTNAVGVWVKDHMPPYTNFVAADNNGVFVADSERGSVNWFIKSLAPGASLTVKLTVSLDADLPNNVTIENVAKYQVTGDEDEPDYNDEPIVEPGSNGGSSNQVQSTKAQPVPASSTTKASTSAQTSDTSGATAAALLLVALCGIACAAYARMRKQLR